MDKPPLSVEDAAKVLNALRLANGFIHPDDPSPLQQQYRLEIGEALAIQESLYALLQKKACIRKAALL